MFIRPKGIATVELFDTHGMSDQDVLNAIKKNADSGMKLPGDLIGGKDPVKKIVSSNLLNHMFAGHLFQKLMSGPNMPNPYSAVSYDSLLSLIILTTTSPEPTYIDSSNETGVPYSLTGNIGGAANNSARGVKLFDIDEIEDYLISEDPNGKESISYRARWLFLPSQGVSSDIHGFSIYYSQYGYSSEYASRGRSGRVLFRDGNGAPDVVNKTANQTMFLEYEVTWMSV